MYQGEQGNGGQERKMMDGTRNIKTHSEVGNQGEDQLDDATRYPEMRRETMSPFLSSPTGTPRNSLNWDSKGYGRQSSTTGMTTTGGTLSPSMGSREGVGMTVVDHVRQALVHCRNELVLLFSKYMAHGTTKPVLLPHILQDELKSVCAQMNNQTLHDSDFGCIMKTVQEAVVIRPRIAFALRTNIGEWHYFRINAEDMNAEEMSVNHYLAFKEKLVSKYANPDADVYQPFVLEWDMKPFTAHQPKITLQSSIGDGVSFLNKTLSLKVFGAGSSSSGIHSLLEFLRQFRHNGSNLLLSQRINTVVRLRNALLRAERVLYSADDEAEISDTDHMDELNELGFLPGWGSTVGRVRESFQLLLDLIQAPDSSSLEKFLSRLPLVFRVVILSPHGFFGQNNVLGLPDTGGQIVYILDQVRALENELQNRLYAAGIKDITPDVLVVTRLIPESMGTSCNERIEHIVGTKHARILRVPFRTEDGRVLQKWISRFEVWPYLEQFTIDATKELMSEIGGKPDFIIGTEVIHSYTSFVNCTFNAFLWECEVSVVYDWITMSLNCR